MKNLRVPINNGHETRLLNQINLVKKKENWRVQLLEDLQNVPISLAKGLDYVHYEIEQVAAFQGSKGCSHHTPVELVPWFVKSWCIQKDDLGLRKILDAPDRRPGRLGLIGHDRNLSLDDTIQKC